jgi:hypothetical protein
MAVIHLETLVVRNVVRAGANVAGTVRPGSKQVNGQASASLSYLRHPSHRFPRPATPEAQRFLADDLGDEADARRAGRSWERAGVLVSRMALTGKSFGVSAKRPAVAGSDLRQHSLPLRDAVGCAGACREWGWAWQPPVQGRPLASTRGASARSAALTRRSIAG